MERSAIRVFIRNTMPPDFAALHPGYLLISLMRFRMSPAARDEVDALAIVLSMF